MQIPRIISNLQFLSASLLFLGGWRDSAHEGINLCIWFSNGSLVWSGPDPTGGWSIAFVQPGAPFLCKGQEVSYPGDSPLRANTKEKASTCD